MIPFCDSSTFSLIFSPFNNKRRPKNDILIKVLNNGFSCTWISCNHIKFFIWYHRHVGYVQWQSIQFLSDILIIKVAQDILMNNESVELSTGNQNCRITFNETFNCTIQYPEFSNKSYISHLIKLLKMSCTLSRQLIPVKGIRRYSYRVTMHLLLHTCPGAMIQHPLSKLEELGSWYYD